MTMQEQVLALLDQVLVPGVMRSLVALNLVDRVQVSEGQVDVTLASAALSGDAQEWLRERVRGTVQGLAGVRESRVEFVDAKPKDRNQVGQVVAVMSGKGGVGKSLVSALIAVSLARQGQEVGVLDADITGPSIPMLFGLHGHPFGSETGMLPVLTRAGIEVMSLNLLLPNVDDAVIWRGPLIGNAIKQFWEDVLWGRLDYLIVDLPPGTADAPLTVMQSLPVSGVVIVFSPQELAAMVVRKAVQMTRKMDVPILGVVENMSYLQLDDGRRLEIFGKSKAEEMAQAAGAPLLAQLPLDPDLARLCDEGRIEEYDSPAVASLRDGLVEALSRGEPAHLQSHD